MDKWKRRPVKIFATVPDDDGENISCMTLFDGRLYYATLDTVYSVALPGFRAWWLRVKGWWSR